MPKSILLGNDKREILVLDGITHIQRLTGNTLIRVVAGGKYYDVHGSESCAAVLEYFGYELDDAESSFHGFKPRLEFDIVGTDAGDNSQLGGFGG